MGAGILLQALGKGSRFCAVAAESPFSTFRDVAYDRLGQTVGCGSWLGRTLFQPVVESGFLDARLRYGVNLNLASAAAAVARTPVPILLIHGTMDRNIPPAHSKRIQQHVAGQVVLWEVPGAGHAGALAQAPGEFERRVLEWFAAPPFSSRHARPNQDPLFRSSGKERDAETGLDYFGARYFSGAQGRWTSPDMIDVTSRRQLNLSNTLNKYVDAANNPLEFIDLDGEDIAVFYWRGMFDTGHIQTTAFNQSTGRAASLDSCPVQIRPRLGRWTHRAWPSPCEYQRTCSTTSDGESERAEGLC